MPALTVQPPGWPSALGPSCPHRPVPVTISEARRRRLRGCGPVWMLSGRPSAAAPCSLRWRNGGGGADGPSCVDGQVLLVHNRTRPHPSSTQGWPSTRGLGFQQSVAQVAAPGELDASGAVPRSEVTAVSNGAGQGRGLVMDYDSGGDPPWRVLAFLGKPGGSCKQLSRREPRSPTAPRVERSGRTVLACPTPSRKHPANQPGTRAEPCSAVLIHGRLRWLHRLPLMVSWHATVSTVPRFHEDGQTARPGNRKGQNHD